MQIRQEAEKDYREVEELTREAFWNKYRPGCFEHLVVHKLRDDASLVKELNYVVEDEGKVVAHIIYSMGKLVRDDGKEMPILIFGPVSVLPKKQGMGFGSLIIEYTLARATELGYPIVAITGDKNYYKQFGFVSASTKGIYYNGCDRSEESDFFMVRILDEEKSREYTGTYYDPSVFEIDDAELESFDATFPKKEKKRRPGMFF